MLEQELWDEFYQLQIFIIDSSSDTITLFNPFQNKYYHLSFNANNYYQIIHEISEILSDRSNNLHGYGIDVFMAERKYISEPIRNESGHIIGYDLADGGFLTCLTEYLNFTPNFVYSNLSQDDEFLISLLYTSTVTENRIAMFSSNARFVLNFTKLNNTVFLDPCDDIKMLYVVPVSYQESPLNIFVYNVFSATAKWVYISSILIFISFWTIIRYCYNKIYNNTSPNNIIIISISILMSTSVRQPPQLYNRIMFLSIVLFTMVISNTYQGTITTQLSIKSTPHQINTLEELFDSNLKISSTDFIKEYISSSNKNEGNIWSLLNSKPGTIYTNMTEGLLMVAHNQTDALLIPYLFVAMHQAAMYDPKTGRDLIHAIPQSPISFMLTYIVTKQCPFIKEFNFVIKIYYENGLIIRELKRATFMTNLVYIKRSRLGQNERKSNDAQPINIHDIETLFMFWFSLLLISFISFLAELFYWKFITKGSLMKLKSYNI